MILCKNHIFYYEIITKVTKLVDVGCILILKCNSMYEIVTWERGSLMKTYIRENIKIILATAVLLICTVLLIGTNEIVAQMLPEISELHIVHYNMDDEVYEYGYTGKEVTPKVERIVLGDAAGNTTIKYEDEISNVQYHNNINVGYADLEISLQGYRGTLMLKKAFRINPAQVQELKITSVTHDAIDLAWQGIPNANGYLVYKSNDNGANFTLIKDVKANESLTYQDTDMQYNAAFLYYVCAYEQHGEEQYIGAPSDTVMQYTALATPAFSSVSCVAYNSVQLKWGAVDGAVGYQIYRSVSRNGKYTCIAELNDGKTTSYTDASCECGIEYYYYIQACQSINGVETYGEASEIKTVKTKPNRVSLSGSGNGTQVNLKWKASTGAQGYEIYKSVDSTSSYKLVKKIEDANTLSWSESGLDKHTAYYYRIRPYCVVNGTTVYGSYSGNYEKEAVIEYNYSGGTGMDVLRQYVGREYVFGGTSATKGWDCSYFVKWTYAKHFGIDLPRTAGEQVGRGTTVSKNNRTAWQPGDLLFYKENGRVSHVAVYLGNGQMIHALSSKYDTLIQDVDYYEKWDKKTSLYCVKRVF